MTDFAPIPTSERAKEYGCERCGYFCGDCFIVATYWREGDVPEDEPWCVCVNCYSDLTGGAND